MHREGEEVKEWKKGRKEVLDGKRTHFSILLLFTFVVWAFSQGMLWKRTIMKKWMNKKEKEEQQKKKEEEEEEQQKKEEEEKEKNFKEEKNKDEKKE